MRLSFSKFDTQLELTKSYYLALFLKHLCFKENLHLNQKQTKIEDEVLEKTVWLKQKN